MDESPHSSIVSEREEQTFPAASSQLQEPPEVTHWAPLLITGLKRTKIHILSLHECSAQALVDFTSRVRLGVLRLLYLEEKNSVARKWGQPLPFCLGCPLRRFQHNRSWTGSWYWGENKEGRANKTQILFEIKMVRTEKLRIVRLHVSKDQNFVPITINTVCCTHWQHQLFYFWISDGKTTTQQAVTLVK